jgi:hypothetical protein
MMPSMVIQMNHRQLQTLTQLQAFLDSTTAVDFAVAAEEQHCFIGRTVRWFAFGCLKRAEGRGAAFPRAGERLFTSAAHAPGQARRRASAAVEALLRLAHQLCQGSDSIAYRI